jgi:hypothetical protein
VAYVIRDTNFGETLEDWDGNIRKFATEKEAKAFIKSKQGREAIGPDAEVEVVED